MISQTKSVHDTKTMLVMGRGKTGTGTGTGISRVKAGRGPGQGGSYIMSAWILRRSFGE